MAFLLQIHIPDPEDVEKAGGPVNIGLTCAGMTDAQATTALTLLHTTITRIEDHMKKYGTGEPLPEVPTGVEPEGPTEAEKFLASKDENKPEPTDD